MSEHKPMADEELCAIQGRLAAITEWPWIAFCRTGVRHRMGITNKRLFDDGDAPEVLDVVELGDNAGGIKSEADAAFIAAAPTDIARLLAEVERLREEVARLEKEADWLGLRLWGTGGVPPVEDFDVRADRIKMWRKAARKAVEEKERYG